MRDTFNIYNEEEEEDLDMGKHLDYL